jgi:chromosome segregation ATPase
MLNHESSTRTDSEKGATAVINLWLSCGLVIAVLGYAVLSGMLILKLGGFEDTRRQAQEAETALGSARTELSTLRHEIDALEKQRGILAPTIADWEKRLKEKAEAEAALTALESKRRQTEADIAQAAKRLEDTNKDLVSAGNQKAELGKEIEKLKAEHLSLTKAITAAKVTWDQAMEAERRLTAAQNELVSLNTQRKQMEADVEVERKRRDQIRGEADDARKGREKLDADSATLRQQAETLKGEKTDLEKRVSDLKAIQTAVQQEERKLDQTRKEVTEWERRRDTAKDDGQQADADLSAARKLLQETSTKQGELTRESSRLEGIIERFKKEKEALEKALGRLEGQQQPKSLTGGQ